MGTDSRNTVFVSYSHKDARWLELLRIHLAPLRRAGELELWDDTKILPGQAWRDEIENALTRARVAVLLISPDFLASDFISSEELPRLLAAAEAGGATILPVIIRASSFTDTPLGRFQAVNSPDHALSKLRGATRDEELVKVSKAVKRALATASELLEDSRPGSGDTRLLPSPSAGSGSRAGEVGSRAENLPPGERDPLSVVTDNDPLVFFPAIAALPVSEESYELLLQTFYYSVVHDEAIKNWLARDPDRAGRYLLDAIQRNSDPGHDWQRGGRAGRLFSPSLSSWAEPLLALIRHHKGDAMQHALAAYGHLGRSFSAGDLKAILIGENEVERGLKYAVEGWTAAYLAAKGWEIEMKSRDLRGCMEWYGAEFPGQGSVDLRSVRAAHYDDLLTRWLSDRSSPYVKKAALRALGERGVTRAVPSIAQLLGADDVETRKDAARALGQIGGVAAAQALFALPEGETYREEVVHVAHELSDDALDDLIQQYETNGSWTDIGLARSIGVARAVRHREYIEGNLSSPFDIVRGVSAIAAARLELPLDFTRIVYEAEPGVERSMATAALLMSMPSEYSKVERTWRGDLAHALRDAPARLIEDVFQCVADVPEAAPVVDAWRPVAATWGARI